MASFFAATRAAASASDSAPRLAPFATSPSQTVVATKGKRSEALSSRVNPRRTHDSHFGANSGAKSLQSIFPEQATGIWPSLKTHHWKVPIDGPPEPEDILNPTTSIQWRPAQTNWFDATFDPSQYDIIPLLSPEVTVKPVSLAMLPTGELLFVDQLTSRALVVTAPGCVSPFINTSDAPPAPIFGFHQPPPAANRLKTSISNLSRVLCSPAGDIYVVSTLLYTMDEKGRLVPPTDQSGGVNTLRNASLLADTEFLTVDVSNNIWYVIPGRVDVNGASTTHPNCVQTQMRLNQVGFGNPANSPLRISPSGDIFIAQDGILQVIRRGKTQCTVIQGVTDVVDVSFTETNDLLLLVAPPQSNRLWIAVYPYSDLDQPLKSTTEPSSSGTSATSNFGAHPTPVTFSSSNSLLFGESLMPTFSNSMSAHDRKPLFLNHLKWVMEITAHLKRVQNNSSFQRNSESFLVMPSGDVVVATPNGLLWVRKRSLSEAPFRPSVPTTGFRPSTVAPAPESIPKDLNALIWAPNSKKTQKVHFGYLRTEFQRFSPVILQIPSGSDTLSFPLHTSYLAVRCPALNLLAIQNRLKSSSIFGKASLNALFSFIYDDEFVDIEKKPTETFASESRVRFLLELTLLASEAYCHIKPFYEYVTFRLMNVITTIGSEKIIVYALETLLKWSAQKIHGVSITTNLVAFRQPQTLYEHIVCLLSACPSTLQSDLVPVLLACSAAHPVAITAVFQVLLLRGDHLPPNPYVNPFDQIPTQWAPLSPVPLDPVRFSMLVVPVNYKLAGISVPSAIVAARWPYFRDNLLLEYPSELASLPGLTSINCVKSLLAYLYTGRTEQFKLAGDCDAILRAKEELHLCGPEFEALTLHCTKHCTKGQESPEQCLATFKELLRTSSSDSELYQQRAAVALQLDDTLAQCPKEFESLPETEQYALFMLNYMASKGHIGTT